MMVNIRFLSLLLLLVYPRYITGDDGKCKVEDSEATDIGDLFHSMQNFSIKMCNTFTKLDACKKQDKANEELKTMVSNLTNVVKALSEMIKEQGEKIQDQDQNIRDLHKGLAMKLRENDLKIDWALNDGTLAPKNTSGIMENLARQERKIDESMDMLRKVEGCTYRPGRCADIYDGNASGIYHIFPNHAKRPVMAWCENSDGGGWTVIQKRFDGSVDFYRDWEDYAEGFGNPASEYWLGLRHVHGLTQAQTIELYVGVTDFNGSSSYAKYASFSVASEEDKFRLSVSGYSGTAGDKLTNENGQLFSTKDQDNDPSTYHRSIRHHGAWWFKYGVTSHLNGRFTRVKVQNREYMQWGKYRKASVMMIRPSNFKPRI